MTRDDRLTLRRLAEVERAIEQRGERPTVLRIREALFEGLSLPRDGPVLERFAWIGAAHYIEERLDVPFDDKYAASFDERKRREALRGAYAEAGLGWIKSHPKRRRRADVELIVLGEPRRVRIYPFPGLNDARICDDSGALLAYAGDAR